MANKMADKKKNASQSQAAEQKARDGEQERGQGKSTKAVTRARVERKGSESKTVTRPRETSRPKAPSETLARLRSNRIMRFLLESYYELRYKVTWPTVEEARNMTIVVIALSVAVGSILGLADYALSRLYLLIVH